MLLVRGDRHGVALERHSTDAREEAAVDDCTCLERDGLVRKNRAFKACIGSDVRRCPDLPEDIGGFCASDQDDATSDGDIERRGNLEDEDGVGVILRVERQITGGDFES